MDRKSCWDLAAAEFKLCCDDVGYRYCTVYIVQQPLLLLGVKSHRCFLVHLCTHSDVPMNSEQSGRGRGRGGWLVDETKCDLETCEWTLMSSDSIVRLFLQNGAFSIRITSYSQRLGSTIQTIEYLCKGLRKFFFFKGLRVLIYVQ